MKYLPTISYFFRDVTYEINMMAQGHAAMMYFNPERKHAFAIYQDRVYHIHAPR